MTSNIKPVVLVLADESEPQFAPLLELASAADLKFGKTVEAFAGFTENASVIFNWSFSRELFRDVFLRCRNLKWAHTRSAGLDSTLFPELINSGVILTNGSGVFSESLAEFVLGAILYFAKDFRRMIRNQMAGHWEQFDVGTLTNRTVGIVGYGDIGRAIGAKVVPLGMKVLALKRHPPVIDDPIVSEFYKPDRCAEMIRRCDYVVVAAPLTKETHHMIGKAEVAAMKSDAVIINVGRGPVIDEEYLIPALEERRIKGAGLDVFEHEPLPDGHPFYKLENVLLSPHCADNTSEWLNDAVRFFVEQFDRFVAGKELLNVVDKSLGY